MSAKVDLNKIDQADLQLRRSFSSISSLIVIQGGRVEYAATYGRTGSLQTLRPMYSVTKSVISTLIGIAIDKGHIESTEQTIADLLDADRCTIPDDSPLADITLHQLLSMSTGIRWRDGVQGAEPMLQRMLKQPDWLSVILKFSVDPSMIDQFQYNSAVSHLLSVILSHRTGLSASEFAESHLFNKMGISNYQWDTDPQGYSTGGWGLQLAPEDMTKLGILFLADGSINNVPVVSSDWVRTSTDSHTSVSSHQHVTGYGYQWWLYAINNHVAFCARGFGGQVVYCVPSLDAVIVITSSLAGRRKNAWPVFQDYLLPAISGE